MKKLKPALVFSFLGIATFASLVGTVSGTLAWYAYNSRVTLSYSGTSVSNSVQLQIGLACDQAMVADGSAEMDAFLETMEEPEVVNGVYYYFAPLGYGLSSSVLNAYLKIHNYATNELAPVTSGYFDPTVHTAGFSEDPATQNSFSFKNGPSAENPSLSSAAEKKNYLKLPFIFRASNSSTETGQGHYLEGAEVWLTDAKGAASSKNANDHVHEALRIFFDRDNTNYTSDFIVNSAVNSAGETKVGGLLDLTSDGYYDFDGTKEVIYGEWDTSELADPTTKLTENYQAPAGGNPYYNLNKSDTVVGYDYFECSTTFCSRHHEGTAYYSYEKLNEIPFRTAKYESLSSIKPTRDPSSGKLSNPQGKVTSVCKTGGESINYIGRVDAYIWLEGWDFAVIDKEQQHAFDYGLTFEINKAASNS